MTPAIWLIAAALAAQAPATPTEIISGVATPLDGDTLVIDQERVRLFGIDAPEMRTPSGPFARAHLDDLVRDKTVACEVVDTDRHKRQVGLCTVGTLDLSAAMVEAGWATVYRIYTTEYDAAELEARLARRGIWAGMAHPNNTSFYEELATWQTGIGAFVGASFGLGAILLGALYNAKLMRRRDDRLRDENARRVSLALYSEVVMLVEILRRRVQLCNEVANWDSVSQSYREAMLIGELPVFTSLKAEIGGLAPVLARSVVHVYRQAYGCDMVNRAVLLDSDDEPTATIYEDRANAMELLADNASKLAEGLRAFGDNQEIPELDLRL